MHSTTHRQPGARVSSPVRASAGTRLPSHLARRVNLLQRESPRLVQRAANAGVDIAYVGVSPLFDGARAYTGPETDWIFTPADGRTDGFIPTAERDSLRRLIHAGIDFRLVYVAHEIRKGQLTVSAGDSGTDRPQWATLDRTAAADAIGPIPPAAGAAREAERLGRGSQHLLAALGKALPVAGAVLAAPLLLAGAAVGALAAGLDPIVFGAIPAGRPTAGQPAAWYVLARWDWPADPGTGVAAPNGRPAG